MSDLPPSYEAATGSPVAAQPNFNGVAASAPPQPSAPPPGQICATQCTTTIAIPPQTTLSPQHLQQPPYPGTAYYPTNTPTPQTNAILRRRSNKSDRKCIWIAVAIIAFAVVCLIVVLVAIKASRRAKSDFQDTFASIYGQSDLPKIDWETIRKNQLDLLEQLNSNRYEPKPFNFN